MRLDIDENRTRAKLFLETNTYTFSMEHLPDGREFGHNGFIIEICDWYIRFFDVIAEKEIALILEACSIERANEKIMNETDAREKYNLWIKGQVK